MTSRARGSVLNWLPTLIAIALIGSAAAIADEDKMVMQRNESYTMHAEQVDEALESLRAHTDDLVLAIEQVAVLERQIFPLMEQMIDGLDQSIYLDMPFLLEERTTRIDFLRELMMRSDVTVDEKLRQILNTYRKEQGYGRTIGTYLQTIEYSQGLCDCEILRVGRMFLGFQSRDKQIVGFWNSEVGTWEFVSASYGTSIDNGIRMARGEIPVGTLILPVPAPRQ